MRKGISLIMIFVLLSYSFVPFFDNTVYGADSPSDTRTFNNHTYTVYNIGLSWSDAKQYCESLGGYLVTITSEEEQRFIEGFTEDKIKNYYWIGATEEDTEGNWKWITGERWSYCNWSSGNPKNKIAGGENYAAIQTVNKPGAKNNWIDFNTGNVDDTENFGFICEWGNDGNWNALTIPTDKLTFIVYDYSTTSPIKSAQVFYGTENLFTDDNGCAVFSANALNDVRIKAPGYCDYEWIYDDLSKDSFAIVYLRKDSNPTLPHVTSIYTYDDDNAKIDLLIHPLEIEEISDKEYTITCTANWKEKTPLSYELYQDPSSPISSTSGMFNIKPSEVFEKDKKIYLRMIDSAGDASTPVEVNIRIKSGLTVANRNDSLPFNSLPSFHIFPMNWFLIGGRSIDLDIGFIRCSMRREGNLVRYALGVNEFVLNPDIWSGYVTAINDVAAGRAPFNIAKINGVNGLPSNVTVLDNWFPLLNASGYLEILYDDLGYVISSKGHLLLSCGAVYSFQSQFMAGPIPMVFDLNFDASLTAQMPIDLRDFKLHPSTSFTASVGLEPGIGPGIVQIFSATINGRLGFAFTMDFATKHSKGVIDGSIFFKIKYLFFQNKWDLVEKGEIMFDFYTGSSPADSYFSFDPTDATQYSLIPKDYETGEWAPLYAQTSSDSTISDSSSTVLQTGIYPYAHPQIAEINGKQVMVWLGDASGRSEINRSQLLYSVYDGGTWSSPEPVWADSETADLEAVIHSDGSNLYVVWQKMNRVLDDSAAIEEIPQYSEIASAKFDVSNNSFVDANYLTDNNTYDFMPNIAIENGEAVFTWINNSDNHVFAVTGTNTFMTSSDISLPVSIQKPVVAYDVDLNNGELLLAFACDEDMDINTTDDISIHLVNNSGDNIISSGDAGCATPVFDNHNLFWYSDDNIYTQSGKLFENPSSINAQYKLIHGVNGKSAFVWMTNDGIMAKTSYDGQTWGNDTLIATVNDPVQFFGGFLTNDDWNFVINTADETTNIHSMIFRKSSPKTDLTLDFLEYSERLMTDDSKLPVTVHITNTGENPIQSVNVVTRNASGGIIDSQNVACDLSSGESAELSLDVQLPQISDVTDFEVEVRAEDEADISCNVRSMSVGYPDLSLDLDVYELGDNAVLSSRISNLSNTAASAVIEIHDGDAEGPIVKSIGLDSVIKGADAIYNYTIDCTELYYTNGVKMYTVVVKSEKPEITDANNSQVFIISQDHEDYVIIYTKASEGGTVTESKIYTINETATFTATPDAGYEFEGWYENNVKIPDAPAIYRFIATKDRTLEARFKKIEHPSTDSMLVFIDTPVELQRVKDSLNISGWALYSKDSESNDISKVEIQVADLPVISADLSKREDLVNIYDGYGDFENSGFRKKIDISSFENGIYTVKINIFTTDGYMNAYTRQFEKQEKDAQPYFSILDFPKSGEYVNDTLKVSGWAIVTEDGITNDIGRVEVKVGTLNAQLAVLSVREDLKDVFPGYGDYNNSGFNVIIDTRSLPDGIQPLTVRVFDTAGKELGSHSRSIHK